MAERVLQKTIREMPAEITDADLDATFEAIKAKAKAAKVQQSGGADKVPSSIQKPKFVDRKSTRLNSSHSRASRMPSSA